MIQSSELILNPDGSVYHLNLNLNILLTTSSLGDQNRVEKITQFFDSIEFSTQKKRVQNPNGNVQRQKNYSNVNRNCPDNIDIVINELDALVNIADLETRKPKETNL
jgi:uridine phosphorylase